MSEHGHYGLDGTLDLALGGGGGVLPLQHGHPRDPFQELGVGHLRQACTQDRPRGGHQLRWRGPQRRDEVPKNEKRQPPR